MNEEVWKDLIPPEEVALMQQGRQQEIEQPLIDLGYLHMSLTTSTSTRDNMAEAIRLFRHDYVLQNLLPHFVPDFENLFELDGLELNLIHQLTGLDNEFPILALPQDGEINLVSRVLHYRLMVLGVFEETTNSPFGLAALDAIAILKNFLAVETSGQVLKLIADLPALFQQVLDSGQLQQTVVAFKYNTLRGDVDALEEVAEEQEDKDNEEALIKEELAIESEIKRLTATIFSKEEEEIQRLEKRNKNKRRRLEKVRTCINQLVYEDLALHKSTRKMYKESKIEKKPLIERKKLLEKDLIQLSRERYLIKEQQAATAKDQSIKRFKNDLVKAQKQLKKEMSLAQIVSTISTIQHNSGILKRSIAQLKNQSGDQRKTIRRLEKQLKQGEKELLRLNKKLEVHQKVEQLQKELTKLKAKAGDPADIKVQLQSIRHQQKQTKELLEQVNAIIKEKDNALQRAIKERDATIQRNQHKIQPLQQRLLLLERKINGLRFRFKAQLKRSLNEEFYQEIRKEVFEGRNRGYLKGIEQDPFNAFMIRLIQVRQWMSGYYFGKLDSQPAGRTFLSIVELTEEENLKRLRLKYVLTKLGDATTGYWLLNAQYFFEQVCELESKVSAKNNAELLADYEAAFEGNPIIKNEVTVAAWKSFNEEIDAGIKTTGQHIRRFYYGAKSLARSIGRIIGKLVRMIVNGIKTIIRIFKNFIKVLYKEIREGLRKFGQGMGFLFGKRQIETKLPNGKMLITKFDFDFDVKNLVSPNLPKKSYEAHIQKCAGYAKNMRMSLKIVAKVIKWIYEIVTTATWVGLLIKIATYYAEMLIKYLAKQNIKKRIRSKIVGAA